MLCKKSQISTFFASKMKYDYEVKRAVLFDKDEKDEKSRCSENLTPLTHKEALSSTHIIRSAILHINKKANEPLTSWKQHLLVRKTSKNFWTKLYDKILWICTSMTLFTIGRFRLVGLVGRKMVAAISNIRNLFRGLPMASGPLRNLNQIGWTLSS